MHTATITVNYYFTSQLLKPSCEAHVLLRESVWFLIRVWWVMDDFSTDEVYYFHMTLYLPVVSVWVVKLFWYISIYRYIDIYLFLWGWTHVANGTQLMPLKYQDESGINPAVSQLKAFIFSFLYFSHHTFSTESSPALPWPSEVIFCLSCYL